MADHRADEDGGFRVFAGGEETRALSWSDLGAKITCWFRPSAAPSPGRGWLAGYRLPIAATVLWLLIVGAYGVGYFLKMQDGGAADRPLPTIDLLFFAMAAAGPVAMIWIVVTMLGRAERLNETITIQSESALALATTIVNLNDTVDAMSAGTTGRLDEACERMERQTAQALTELRTALREIAGRVDATVLDSVILLDKSIRERLHQVEQTLAAERGAFAERLDSDATRMTQKIEASATDTKARLDRAISTAIAEHKNQLAEINRLIERALGELAEGIAHSIDARAQALDEGMRQNQAVLRAAAEATRRTIESDLVKPISAVRQTLADTIETLAANPPATADELAALLAEAAEAMIAPERARLAEAQARMAVLEDKAQALLVQIDRTSRLTPALGDAPPARPAAPAGDAPGAALPLGDLPDTPARTPLDWTAVVRVLDGAEPKPGTRAQLAQAARDPDVAALLRAAEPVRDGLAEDGVYLEDLRPAHCPAAIWCAFALGERGAEVGAIAGLDDDIAGAIVRARLRRQDGFRAAALRFARGYIRLLQRAADEIGADQRLVEMAETETGRAFIALADPLALLDRALPPAPPDDLTG